MKSLLFILGLVSTSVFSQHLITVNTIGYHNDRLEWIPTDSIFVEFNEFDKIDRRELGLDTTLKGEYQYTKGYNHYEMGTVRFESQTFVFYLDKHQLKDSVIYGTCDIKSYGVYGEETREFVISSLEEYETGTLDMVLVNKEGGTMELKLNVESNTMSVYAVLDIIVFEIGSLTKI